MRWLRLLAALAAAGTAAFGTLCFLVAFGYGAMWLFLFGDGTWPRAADLFAQYGLISIGLAAGAVAAWGVFRAIMRD